MAETKAAFARAHIPEKDFGKEPVLESAVNMIMVGALVELRKDLAADSVVFSTMNVAEVAPPRCLYYENGIGPRDDIALVAVCFYGKDRQVIVAPFFREGKIDGATLRKFMDEEYGTGKVAQTGAGKDWVHVWLWFERPWIHAGMLTKKYIFLFDLKRPMIALPGISAWIVYLDAWKFSDVRSDLEGEKESAKKDARKGL